MRSPLRACARAASSRRAGHSRHPLGTICSTWAEPFQSFSWRRRSRAARRVLTHMQPAQEDVARGLHRSLPGDDPLAMILELARRRNCSSTQASASFNCRNSGSWPSRPSSRAIHARVPTLPTPTTLRAKSTARTARAGYVGRLKRGTVFPRAARAAHRTFRRVPCRGEFVDRHDQRRIGHDARLPSTSRVSWRTPTCCPSCAPWRASSRSA